MMKLRHSALSIAAGPVWLEALLAHSPDAAGLILIAQNAVGNHRDSREAHFARRLQNAGFATLLFDLETTTKSPATLTPASTPRCSASASTPCLNGCATSHAHHPARWGWWPAARAAVQQCARWLRSRMLVSAFVCRGGRPGLAGISPAAPSFLPDAA
jgi:putative phosphoribosyl transferase